MSEFQVRTDLALEARERFEEDVEIRGVAVEESYDERRDIRVTVVRIQTENGAKAMGKPIGTYITLEAPRMSEPDEDYHREVSEKLAEYLKKLLDVKNEKSVLVVGLGNREVTPDALGPEVAGHLRVTRHVVREYGKTAFAKEKVHLVSAIVPGVMAQTGMETLEVVQGIVAETKPDYVVVIDALAARSSKRLNRTIQLSDAGIQPGSGVGNHRNSAGHRCANRGGRGNYCLRCHGRSKERAAGIERHVRNSEERGRDDPPLKLYHFRGPESGSVLT